MYYTGAHSEVERGHYLDVSSTELDAAAYDSESSDVPAMTRRGLAVRRLLAAATVLGVTAGACLLAVALLGTAPAAAGRHQTTALVQLDAAEPKPSPDAQSWFLKPQKAAAQQEAPKAAALQEALRAPLAAVPTHAPHKTPARAPAHAASEPAKAPPTQAPVKVVVQDELKPVEDLHDGNLCDLDEELFNGLCYKKCSLLTMGQEPIRSSPWSCCRKEPCMLPANEVGSVGKTLLCNGYDISASGKCPHKPGACLTDEEMHLGVCYKKCSLLTQGKFPFRVAAATCCKTQGMGCLDIFNDRTSSAFAVGGGAGDRDNSTPGDAHLPLTSLTEQKEAAKAAPGANATAEKRPPMPEPVVNGTSGSGCKADEELYGGLCYKTCSLLTGGIAEIRTSSWTCCESHPCTLSNQKGSVGSHLLCNGFDVDSDGKCPRAPGTCHDDEEFHLDVCYRKCSILTDGEYPHRVAAATCCKGEGLECLNFANDKTSSAFDVGSGVDAKRQKQEYVPKQELEGQHFRLQK